MRIRDLRFAFGFGGSVVVWCGSTSVGNAMTGRLRASLACLFSGSLSTECRTVRCPRSLRLILDVSEIEGYHVTRYI